MTASAKVALIHDYLVHIRGGERVLMHLRQLFPNSDVYVLVATDDAARLLGECSLRKSMVSSLPWASRAFRIWLPLYPQAVEQFDLHSYDLVISNSSGFAHGVLTQPHTCHICYCLSPFRYVWSSYHALVSGYSSLPGLAMRLLLHSIRAWDRQAADRVDYYAAISRVTQQRIRKFYRREAVVIHPPVDIDRFLVSDQVEDYYLLVSALVAYKRVDIAVEAFNALGLPLVIVGNGPELRRLRAMAKSNIKFLGSRSDEDIREYYSRCRAFVFPTEEDYGITPLEAQASGRPVIAYGAGGALETVVDGTTGVFFWEQNAESLAAAVAAFDASQFDPHAIRQHASHFGVPAFHEKMTAFIEASFSQHSHNMTGEC